MFAPSAEELAGIQARLARGRAPGSHHAGHGRGALIACCDVAELPDLLGPETDDAVIGNSRTLTWVGWGCDVDGKCVATTLRRIEIEPR